MHNPLPPQVLRRRTVENGGLAERQVGALNRPFWYPTRRNQRGAQHPSGTTTAMKGSQTAGQPSCGLRTHLKYRARVEPRPTGQQWVQRQRLLWGRAGQTCHFSRAAKWVHGPSRLLREATYFHPRFSPGARKTCGGHGIIILIYTSNSMVDGGA